jgi:CRISPR-associated protein Cmr1
VPTASPEEAWRELGQFWARFRKGHFAQAYSPMSGGKWRDYRQVLCQLRSQGNTLRLAKPFLGLPIVYQEIQGCEANLCFTGTLEPAAKRTHGVACNPKAYRACKAASSARWSLVMHALKPDKIRVNSQEYALAAPTKDPVLQALGAADVLDAVLKGVKQHFGQRSVSFDL